MKKYISIALVFVVVLLIMALIIRGSNDSEEVYDGFVQQVEQNDTPSSSNPVGQLRTGLEIPCYDFVVDEQIMAKRGYTVSFNPDTKLPNWVAYELTADETDGPWTRKGLRFVPDPYCKGEQADREDYRNSGYSHGHLAPAGDMKWDSLAMIESFYYTNCIPQDANLNTGKWHQLEEKTRKLAREYGNVYIVTGPVIQYDSIERIGNHGIPVPIACYKALMIRNKERYSAIGFVMLNGGEQRSMKECACTVDELEALLGLNMFYNLPNDIEEGVESKVIWDDWNLR